MKSASFSEHDEQDEEIIKRLKELGSLKSEYPPELLAARRATFLAQVEVQSTAGAGEELSAADQEVVRLLGNLKSAQVEYPAELLAARRAAFLRQVAGVEQTSFLDRLRASIQRIVSTSPTLPSRGFLRTSLVIGSILAAVLMGSALFRRAEQFSSLFPSQAIGTPTHLLPTKNFEVALKICKPEDPSPACSSGELAPDQDLAHPGNGRARPAVSKDSRSGDDGVHRAARVNDGRDGESWVSDSPNSWVKIDLGQVTTINTVSLRKGSPGFSDDNLGQFVIAVALRDVYTDGNSNNDYTEYAQVFNSAQTGFSGNVAQAETIRTQFPSVQARYVKITFEKAGAAIEEVGVFMVSQPVLDVQATGTQPDDPPGMTSTSQPTDTPSPTSTTTFAPTGPPSPTDRAVPLATNTRSSSSTPTLIPTNTRPPSSTPTPTSTNTQTPSRTPTPTSTNTQTPTKTPSPSPTDPLPSDTPTPSPTEVPPTSVPPTPTAISPTAVPPTVQAFPASTEPIVITGNDQTLSFTCDGNAAEIRGHANTVTLWGSCSSITVTGNGNHVFWQSGSPVIVDQGQDNIISQW